jgi:hypothetical protein
VKTITYSIILDSKTIIHDTIDTSILLHTC